MEFIQNRGNAIISFLQDFVPPKSKYYPSLFLQTSSYFLISLHISLDLGNPKIPVAIYFILSIGPIIAVPEITVTENSNFPSNKCDVWFSKNRFVVSCKGSNTIAVQLLTNQLFKSGIAVAHSAHIVLDLLFSLFPSHCVSPRIS